MKKRIIRIFLRGFIAWHVASKGIYCASQELRELGRPLTTILETEEPEDYLDTIKSIDIAELLEKPMESQIGFFSSVAIPTNLYDPSFYEHSVFQVFLKQLEETIQAAHRPNLPLQSLCLVLRATFLALCFHDSEQKEVFLEEAKRWEIWADYLLQTDT